MSNKSKFLKTPKAAGFVVLSTTEFARDIFKFKIVTNDKGQKYIRLNGLYRDGIISSLAAHGYCKRYHAKGSYDFIRDTNNILEVVEPCMMKDEVFVALKKEYSDVLVFEYEGTTASIESTFLHETFLLQSHLVFNETFLEHLPTHEKPMLKDTPTEAFFPFINAVCRVTEKGISKIEYSELQNLCIWRQHILKREYHYIDYESCLFEDFIANISTRSGDAELTRERQFSIITAIGYLLHNYSPPSKGQAVVAYDEEITDLKNPMGGTGKGIIQQAISQLRTVVKIDGKKFDERDKFSFQDIDERTQVVFFDDVKADLGFDRFNSILTEGWNVEPKRKPSFFIEPKDSPKVYITSNAVIQGGGTTAKRRQHIIELAPFYSNLIKRGFEPIIDTHGCEFFSNQWSPDEWNSFFTFMLLCVKGYLEIGLQNCRPIGLIGNKVKQGTSPDFYEWITSAQIDSEKRYDLAELFDNFKLTYYGEHSDFARRTFTNWLKTYALVNNNDLIIKRSNGKTSIQIKCTSAQETII